MDRWRALLGGSVPITRFGHAELINAIALGRFRGDYDDAELLGALNDVRHDLDESRLCLADLSWRAAFDRCSETQSSAYSHHRHTVTRRAAHRLCA